MNNRIDVDIKRNENNMYAIDIIKDSTVRFRTAAELSNVDYNIVNDKIILEFDAGNCKIEPIKE